MHSQPDTGRPIFVTGANEDYFWLANALLAGLEERMPGVDARVLDFGLAPAQAEFLRARRRWVGRPPEVPADAHPYVLKTYFGRYVRDLPGPNIVWLDGDILCVGDVEDRMRTLFDAMERHGRQVAAAPDMGPNGTLARFVAAYAAPALASYVRAEPSRGDLRYLNTGVIAFRDAQRFFDDWERLAARIPGEICIDQNAFNMLVHADPGRSVILEAGVWNVHSGLLADVRQREDRWHCGARDEPALFLHATSHRGESTGEVRLSLRAGGVEVAAMVKTFNDPAMRRAHLETLRRFVTANAADLRACGVVA